MQLQRSVCFEFLGNLSEYLAGYAIDVDGVLVEGVLVEKEVARATQEAEARQYKGVSITEHVVGNSFKTEVKKSFNFSQFLDLSN